MSRFVFFMAFMMAGTFCFGQSQADMNHDAFKVYEKADKALNTAYQKILKMYSEDTAFIRSLKNAQRIWIQFRDAEMKAMYPDREAGYYGSIQPVCWYDEMTSLTNDRLKRLKIWIEGIKEGDLCSGSVRTN